MSPEDFAQFEAHARREMDKHAREVRRHFFYAVAMFCVCTGGAVTSLYFEVVVNFLIWWVAAGLWGDNVRLGFKAWRRFDHFIIRRKHGRRNGSA